jgi:hypothetical protein
LSVPPGRPLAEQFVLVHRRRRGMEEPQQSGGKSGLLAIGNLPPVSSRVVAILALVFV